MTARTLHLWTIALTIALAPQIGLGQPASAEDVEMCRGIDQDIARAGYDHESEQGAAGCYQD